jgi:hypothetical protein
LPSCRVARAAQECHLGVGLVGGGVLLSGFSAGLRGLQRETREVRFAQVRSANGIAIGLREEPSV